MTDPTRNRPADEEAVKIERGIRQHQDPDQSEKDRESAVEEEEEQEEDVERPSEQGEEHPEAAD